jgi:hypothetical protein
MQYKILEAKHDKKIIVENKKLTGKFTLATREKFPRIN